MANPTAPTSSAAPGVWTLDQAQQYIKAGTWPLVPPWFSVSSLGSQSNAVVTNSFGNIIYGYSNSSLGDSFALVGSTGISASAGAYIPYSQLSIDVCVDSSDNIYSCTWNGSTYQRWYVAKYNSAGVNTWAKQIDFAIDHFALPKIGVDSLGNVYLCGRRTTSSNTNYSLCIVKLDSSGSLVWANNYYKTPEEIYNPSYPLFDASNNLIVALRQANTAGICTISPSGTASNVYDYTNISLDGGDGGTSIAKDNSGNFYISGSRTSPNQPALLKLDSSFNVVWCYYINDPSGNLFRTASSGVAIEAATNNVYLGNFYLSNPPSQACIASITNDGSLSWIRSIGVNTNTTRPASGRSVAAYQGRFYFGVSNQTLSTSPLIFSATSNGGVTGTSGNYSSNAITSSLSALSPVRSSTSFTTTSITPTVSNSTSTSSIPTFIKTSL